MSGRKTGLARLAGLLQLKFRLIVMAKRYNPRLAKSCRCYTVEAMSVLYHCHKNTVRNWLGQGLEPIDNARPTMVHGTILNAFHTARRGKAKQPCAPGEIFCLGCSVPRKPHAGMVEYTPTSASLGLIKSICPVCDRLMYQRVGVARLKVFQELFGVEVRKE